MGKRKNEPRNRVARCRPGAASRVLPGQFRAVNGGKAGGFVRALVSTGSGNAEFFPKCQAWDRNRAFAPPDRRPCASAKTPCRKGFPRADTFSIGCGPPPCIPHRSHAPRAFPSLAVVTRESGRIRGSPRSVRTAARGPGRTGSLARARARGQAELSRYAEWGTHELRISRWSALPGLLLNTTALEPAWGSSPGPANRQDINAVTVLMRTARRHFSDAGVPTYTRDADEISSPLRHPPICARAIWM